MKKIITLFYFQFVILSTIVICSFLATKYVNDYLTRIYSIILVCGFIIILNTVETKILVSKRIRILVFAFTIITVSLLLPFLGLRIGL
ncbi:hypothetical protein HNP81_002102 [Peribacillus huizhouensis]|uniref:DUF1516 family protein n=1 Tax=Peribacillus huizhouensis TaxID=1501239 RepID=A0ABR6CR47_9BACI|nr:hypothetical protein [Peribacillus huizhouensis]